MDLFVVKNENGKVMESGFANKAAAKAYRDEHCTTTFHKETGVPIRKPNVTVALGKDHYRYKG